MKTKSTALGEMAATRQVIHMDQGVAYSPEYRATRDMSDYPSRKMQIARALALLQIQPSERSISILRHHILSRQGERWQNFGEDPEEFTWALIEARRFLRDQGLSESLSRALSEDHKKFLNSEGPWREALPTDLKSDTAVILSPTSWENLQPSAPSLGRILHSAGVSPRPIEGPISSGWAYFAHGFIDEGVSYLRAQLRRLEEGGIRRLLTTCGETTYVWRHLAPRLGLHHEMEVLDVMELMKPGSISKGDKIFVYAGSFYLRYLLWAQRLNVLFPVTGPKVIAHSEEHLRLYDAVSGRVNELTIWQKPLCPEFPIYDTIPRDTLDYIYSDAMSDYFHAPECLLILANPYSFREVRIRNPEIPVAYIWDLAEGKE